ncbi:type IV pilus biogenesis protein PilM [Paenibacillus soyae]|uniref:Pilus assembly protein PilM n=1 Tax=Paenibacillus soyae TaxID=2969249 RepID=A0A9X2MZP5_9BACL|nr:pilus assembly protein PilM [Paenibacillus soyae]MCR2806517.1 pilus assembly protein PilM [Paenibacillus soyae]
MQVKGSILRRLSKSSQSIGIEVTETHVKIAEASKASNEKAELLTFVSLELPAGLIEDGKVNDWVQLEHKIKEALGTSRFSSKTVHFAIPSQLVMVRSLRLPDIAHLELRKLIQFEMNNNFRLAFEDPFYDFVKLPRSDMREEAGGENNNQPMCEVMVVAAPVQVLRQYRQLFESLGLVPSSFEIGPFSLLRLMENSGLLENNVQILVNVNERQCEITIISDGHMQITRHVEIIFKSIIQEPAEGQNENEWLNSYSSPEQTFHNGVLDLIAEIERLMNFYNYTLNNGQKILNNILLAGDLPEMIKVRNIMAQNMNQPVRLIEWSDLHVTGSHTEWKVHELAIPLGLALRGNES